MLKTDYCEFDYEPYPICYLHDVLDADLYASMVEQYPSLDLFQYMPNLGHKYSLSEFNNPEKYHAFIKRSQVWKDFHDYVKSDEFIERTLEFLKSQNVDLDVRRRKIVSKTAGTKTSLMSRVRRRTELSARFEFSMMSPDGGHILPHTDAPNKIITLVVSMIKPGEWDEAWGGGTAVCLPRDRTKVYNQRNDYMGFEDVETLKTFPFVPNQCVLFIKTYNSWHHVNPIQAPSGSAMRKTLTINIERRL